MRITFSHPETVAGAGSQMPIFFFISNLGIVLTLAADETEVVLFVVNLKAYELSEIRFEGRFLRIMALTACSTMIIKIHAI